MNIQMRSAGIVRRQEIKIKENKLKKNYAAKREYKVHIEGVQFSHVRYIVFAYLIVIPLAILIAVGENIHYRLKYARNRVQHSTD